MIQWIACNLHTGDTLASLPGLLVDYPIINTIGQYDTATAHLILDGSQPVNWLEATTPGAALLACYDDDDDDMAIQYAAYVNFRQRNGETDGVDLTLVTTEGYLNRRYISQDLDYTTPAEHGQNAVVEDLVERFIKDGSDGDGLPITVVNVDNAPGTLIGPKYRDADSGTVYDALQALSALDDGPEWTIRWEWRSDYSGLKAKLYVGSRLGTAAPATGSPKATFEMPGCLITANLTEDYSEDKGANAVEAYTSVGGIAPSDWQTASDMAGRPRFEFRFEPQTGQVTSDELVSYARKAVRNMKNGGNSVALVADRQTAPRYNSQWFLGDDIGYVIGGLNEDGEDIVPAFPGGLTGVERVVGVQLGIDTISPVAEVKQT